MLWKPTKEERANKDCLQSSELKADPRGWSHTASHFPLAVEEYGSTIRCLYSVACNDTEVLFLAFSVYEERLGARLKEPASDSPKFTYRYITVSVYFESAFSMRGFFL